jgi:hypothetical protein
VSTEKGSFEIAYNYLKKETTKEEKEENRPRNLQRPQAVLDYPGAVLAMGQGRGCDKDGGRSSDRHLRT